MMLNIKYYPYESVKTNKFVKLGEIKTKFASIDGDINVYIISRHLSSYLIFGLFIEFFATLIMIVSISMYVNGIPLIPYIFLTFSILIFLIGIGFQIRSFVLIRTYKPRNANEIRFTFQMKNLTQVRIMKKDKIFLRIGDVQTLIPQNIDKFSKRLISEQVLVSSSQMITILFQKGKKSKEWKINSPNWINYPTRPKYLMFVLNEIPF